MKKQQIKALFLIIVAVLFIDILSKVLVRQYLFDPIFYPKVLPLFHIFGIQFSLTYATNKGAAWGLFAGYSTYLFLFRLFLVGIVFGYLFFSKVSLKFKFALSLIFAGALGNIVDTLARGYVIDMFLVNLWGYNYPVFNIADTAIFIGITLMCYFSLQKKKELKIVDEN